ncbi:MAG: sulfite exporter TauE/SafE family protein [Nocardioidaceae bacterium]
MILGLAPWALAALAIAVLVGATVQGTVGLGLGLVGAPITGLVEPSLMPGLMIWLAMAYPVVTLARDWRHIDWRGIGWLLPARVPGTVLGVAVVAWASDRTLGVAVGAMVVIAVVVTGTAVTVPVRRSTLAGTGLLAGVTGTATSISGPPVALLYQHRSPDQVRATLAFFFGGGAGLSLIGLQLGGSLSSRDLSVAVLMLPSLLLGFAASLQLRARLDARHARTAVLWVCGASGLALLVRSLIG